MAVRPEVEPPDFSSRLSPEDTQRALKKRETQIGQNVRGLLQKGPFDGKGNVIVSGEGKATVLQRTGLHRILNRVIGDLEQSGLPTVEAFRSTEPRDSLVPGSSR